MSVVGEFQRTRWLLRYHVAGTTIKSFETRGWFLKTLKDTGANSYNVDAVLDFGEVVNVDTAQLTVLKYLQFQVLVSGDPLLWLQELFLHLCLGSGLVSVFSKGKIGVCTCKPSNI